MIKKSNSGQVIIEAIVAITIAVTGLLGIFELLSRSLSLNKIVGNQYVAANLTAEGIEIVKNLIDNNFLQGAVWNKEISDGIYEAAYDDENLNQQLSPNINDCNSSFVRQNANPLAFNPDAGLYAYGFPNLTNYKRVICIENLSDGNEIKVNSITAWTARGGGAFDINLEDYFFNWR